MKKGLVVCLFLFQSVLSSGMTDGRIADHRDLDSLLVVLDQTVANKKYYLQLRQDRIDSLQGALLDEHRSVEKFWLCQRIFNGYFDFQNDYAMDYVMQMQKIGEEMEPTDPRYSLIAKINQASLLRYTGQLKEAAEILDEIRNHELSPSLHQKYISERIVNLTFLRDNTLSPEYRTHYDSMAEVYRDSLFMSIGTDEGLLFKVERFLKLNDPQSALEILHKEYESMDPLSKRAGTLAYNMALCYEKNQDSVNFKRYLTLSAISDIRNGVRGYKSLQRLATVLYDLGDIDRGYNYMRCSIEDALMSSARIRTQEATKMFVVITGSYQQKMEQKQHEIVTYLWTLGIVGILLLLSLTGMGLQYFRLLTVKRKLFEANVIKESYLGVFIEAHLNILSRMNVYQMKSVKLLKKQNDWEGVEQFLNNMFNTTDDLKELYRKFDAAILHVFPNFVEEFNELMAEPAGESATGAGRKKLTTEQRIAALIRLGINSSEKIALLLRYSVRTIYNNRSQMRLKAKNPESLEVDIMRIGLPRSFASRFKISFFRRR